MKNRVLILGGNGMLGHKMYKIFSGEINTWATFHKEVQPIAKESQVVSNFDALDSTCIEEAIESVKPTTIVNCIGIIKQKKESSNVEISTAVNSNFPHRLSKICIARNIRLIHLSTDCVFSGHKGMYKEFDFADPVDVYGRTKLLGEVSGKDILTIRMSAIGWEIANFKSLLSWFAFNKGDSILGYKNAIYTGLSSISLSKTILEIIQNHNGLSGLYHIASDPISKFDILEMLRIELGWNCNIIPQESFFCDRSLSANRFKNATGWSPNSWKEMIYELAEDWQDYKEIYEAI